MERTTRPRFCSAAQLGIGLVALTMALPAMGQAGAGRQRPVDRVSGTVQSITDTALTVQPMARRGNNANPVTVTLDEATLYGALANATTADLTKDAAVVALQEGEGEAALAKGVVVYTGDPKDPERLVAGGAMGVQMQLRVRAGGGGGQPAPLRQVSGRIKSADGGNLVITTKDGDVTLKLAADVLVGKVNDAKRDDVKVGGLVAAMLPADYKEGDPKLAKAVVVLPARPRPGRAQ